MKIATILGARPQFIKAANLSRIIQNIDEVKEIVINTGQHYDPIMSESFFSELDIPQPDINLEIGSCSQGRQTGRMLDNIEEILLEERPDWVLVYGDSNTTISGALAAVKLHIPVAHIDAGIRINNRNMPEEINRLATDHISDCLFAPTQKAMDILTKEGLADRSVISGDILLDSLMYYKRIADRKAKLNKIADVEPGNYYLATIHRPENTDNINNLQSVFLALSELDCPVIVPLHPRTHKLMDDITYRSNVQILPPAGYLEMITLLSNCNKVLTDSGSMQKEAYFLQKPCITFREETEWTETLEGNWNFLVGTNRQKILDKIGETNFGIQNATFGDGKAAHKIIAHLMGL